jgi:hypothetical protein
VSARYWGINTYARRLMKKLDADNRRAEQEQEVIYAFLSSAEQSLERGKVPNRAGVLRALRSYVPYWRGDNQ